MRTETPIGLFLILALLVLPSCRSMTDSLTPTVELGSYVLESIDGRTLPTTAPCGVFRVQEGRITLGANRAATYTLRYAFLGTEDEITFSAAGTYQREGDILLLALRGGWSHQNTLHDQQITLQVEPMLLLQRHVGAECDASSTKQYRLSRP